jgi:hypothetical protein
MSPAVFVIAVFVGASLTGLWLAVRLERFAPKSGRGAAACFALAWLVPGASMPFIGAALGALPVGVAILVSAFPTVALTFCLIAFGLHWLASLLGHAVR